MSAGSTAEPVFCRTCRYRLDPGRGVSRCPECGRVFDPGNPSSYLTEWGLVRSRTWYRVLGSPIAWVLALAPVAGMLDVCAQPTRDIGLYSILLIGTCALLWCAGDAGRHGRSIGGRFKVGVLVLPLVMLPLYVVRSRRARRIRLAGAALAILGGAIALSRAGHAAAVALGLG